MVWGDVGTPWVQQGRQIRRWVWLVGCWWFWSLFFKVYFIFIIFCVLFQTRLLRTHTWAYITKMACRGLPNYIMTLITNIKHRKPGPHHPDLPRTHHHLPTPGGGRRPNPLVSGCYGGGTLGFRHCRWFGVMWGRTRRSRAVKQAGGCGWWGVGFLTNRFLFLCLFFYFTKTTMH